MKIKILLHLVKSKPDVNGNVYYIATLTSVKTGKPFSFIPSHGPNLAYELRAIGYNPDAIYHTQAEVKIKDFNSLNQWCKVENSLKKVLKMIGEL